MWCEAELKGCLRVQVAEVAYFPEGTYSFDSTYLFTYASWAAGGCCVWKGYEKNSMLGVAEVPWARNKSCEAELKV